MGLMGIQVGSRWRHKRDGIQVTVDHYSAASDRVWFTEELSRDVLCYSVENFEGWFEPLQEAPRPTGCTCGADAGRGYRPGGHSSWCDSLR